MLYALASFSEQIGPLNVFRYITFRTGGAIMTALLFVHISVRGTWRPGKCYFGGSPYWEGEHRGGFLGGGGGGGFGEGGVRGFWGRRGGRHFVVLLVFLRKCGLFPYIPGVAELAIVCGAIVGAGFACLLRESNGCSMRW